MQSLKRFSKHSILAVSDSKAPVTERTVSVAEEAPPGYNEPSHGAPNESVPTDFDSSAGSSIPVVGNLICGKDDNPSPARCLAHLKLLMAFHNLRQKISNTEGLFGIDKANVEKSKAEPSLDDAKAEVAIKEKRWAVYVARAAVRFAVWWQNAIPARSGGTEYRQLARDNLAAYKDDLRKATMGLYPIDFTEDDMPPLDVLMVWHAYTLNPRTFLEDCLRYGKMDFWKTGLPWTTINKMIDGTTFEYTLTKQGRVKYMEATGAEEDNLDMPAVKTIRCGVCDTEHKVPWTTHTNTGFADPDFEFYCEQPTCGGSEGKITHGSMAKIRFMRDAAKLELYHIPMPGTVLDLVGVPGISANITDPSDTMDFPNKVTTVLSSHLKSLRGNADIASVRDVFTLAIADREMMRNAKGSKFSAILLPSHKVSIRRMFSHYWGNASPFGLDLAGAVIRQGSFVEKMAEIDWYHSPSVASTLTRLVIRYHQFFALMKAHPTQIIVPTLDIDLAWHTHQTDPSAYYDYSIEKTKKFVDHDDKIDEGALSKAYEFTSKAYQKMFNQCYSECTCWYCQSIREAHTGFFSSTPQLHTPADGVHISAHSAVRMDDPKADAARKAMERRLEVAYQKVAKKHAKQGKKAPERPQSWDSYYLGYAYGGFYPYGVMYYPPYAANPCYYGGYYAGTAACMTGTAGGAGNCAGGTCGAGVAAGSCGSGSGGCGSGAAAGGCGGGGGGCGGGGGGCGGGGGGGGCGGGGG